MDAAPHFLPPLQFDDTRNAGAKVNISRSVELMENHMAARPYSAAHPIAVAAAHDGQPLIFSIDAVNGFHLIARDPRAAGGWRQPYALIGQLGAGSVAQQFAVFQMPDGALVLAVAIRRPGPAEEASDLYITAPIANDPDLVDWANLKWQACPAPRADLTIREIAIGRDSRTGSPYFFLNTTPTIGDAVYWVLSASTITPSAWRPYALPTNARDIIDIAFGSHALGDGVYILYRAGQDLTLLFTTIDGKITCALTPPANAAKLEVLADDRGLSTLYVAGDELHVFAPANQLSGARGAVIPLGKDVSRCRGLIACRDAQTIALWVLTQDRHMVYISAERAHPDTWSAPIALRGGVGQMAPLRNPRRMSNEIFWVGADSTTLGYLTQDPTTRTWTETPILLPDSGKAIEYYSYVTTICLTDKNNYPLHDVEVTLGASEWVYASVNGAYYDLDPTSPVKVTTDSKGCLFIDNQINSIATPTFFLKSASFRETAHANPSAKVNARLAAVRAADIPAPVGDAPKDPATREAMVRAIHELVTLTMERPAESGGLLRGALHPDADNLIAAARRPAGHAWGLSLPSDGPALFLEPASAATILSGGGPGVSSHRVGLAAAAAPDDSWISRAIDVGADILESLWQGLEKAVHFVVQMGKDVAEFFIDLGDRVVKFLVRTVEQVATAINWIFKEGLGLDLAPVVRWLGFMFDWGDILLTHKAAYHLTRVGYQSVLNKADQLEDVIKETFKQVRTALGGNDFTFDDSNEIFQKRPKEALVHQHALLNNTPQGSWAQNALEKNLGAATVPVVELVLELSQIFLDTIETEGKLLEAMVDNIIDDVGRNIDTLSFADIIRRVAKIIIDKLVLGTIENVVISVVQVAEAVGRAVWAILNVRWDIPLLTWLYENKIAPGSKLTLLDLTCLVSAIPTTIFYKIAMDEAPFTAARVEAFSKANSVEDLVAEFHAADARRGPLRANAGAALALGASNAGALGAALGGAASPAIASFSPLSGLTNSLVTIRGTGLAAVTKVTFTKDKQALIVEEGRNDAVLPVRAPWGFSDGPITVSSPGGDATSKDSFTINQSKVAGNNVQVVLGFLLSFSRLASGICYTVSEGADLAANRPPANPSVTIVKRNSLEAKLAFDLITYGISFLSAAISTPNSDRKKIDLAVQYSQIIPRIKDGIQVMIWRGTGTEALRPLRTNLALFFETIFGAVTLPLIVASTVLQSLENPEELTPSDARTVVGLKSTQNLCNAINQILSAPKGAIPWMPPNPPMVIAKGIMVTFRVGVSVIILPGINLARVIEDLAMGHEYVDM